MADVRREKELAERRKNEPQLGSSQDHLVRKIFSKFRRAQQNAQVPKAEPSSDVEKGETEQESKKVSKEGDLVKICFNKLALGSLLLLLLLFFLFIFFIKPN